MDIQIRAYQQEDIASIVRIYNEAIAAGDSLMAEHPIGIDQMAERLRFTERATYVSISDGKISGAYMIRSNYKDRGSHVANATYIVSKQFQGRGIGFMLGEHSLGVAKELGYLAMQFNAVVSTNKHAVLLWQKLGFSSIGTVPNAFRLPSGKLVDTKVMYKMLTIA